MDLSEGFKKLQQEYVKTIPEKIVAIEESVAALCINPSQETLASLKHLVHKLAGSAGSFGFAEASTLCKSWDQKLTHLLEHYSQEELLGVLKEFPLFLQNLHMLLTKAA